MGKTVRLLAITHARRQLSMRFAVDAMQFSTSYWYDTVDFYALRAKYGEDAIDNVLFHIAAFEINKLCSLRPDHLDWGPFADFVTAEFEALWREIFVHVWAQWRFENEDPFYKGPDFRVSENHHARCRIDQGPQPRVLSFFGGGKDSIVAARLLSRVGARYDTLSYSSSLYGTHDAQHRLTDGLIRFCHPGAHRRQWVFDDFLQSPVLTHGDHISAKTLTSAETPSSIFAALPYVLQHGYSHLCLAHERSADTGQTFWENTGEDINHQWGKSYAAEKLINDYVANNLIQNVQYFSILKPIYDVIIFAMLRDHLDAVPFTHSCNIAKPWCKRCAKCVYVWLNYLAYLPADVVIPMFGENLFDIEENMLIMRQMLGLEAHMPFECIGQMDEVKLAFELCRSKGFHGKAMDLYVQDVPKPNIAETIDRYTTVDATHASIPAALRPAVMACLNEAAIRARADIEDALR